MGSTDSGRRGGVKKGHVERHVALRLTELKGAGALTPGASGTLSWGAAAQPEAAVAFRASAADFTLEYQVDDGASVKSVVERVPLTCISAGFGGTRRYFRCPDPGCGRRVMVLYLVHGLFRCRRCHRLAYECQGEDASRRAGRRADKARARLGYLIWQPFKLAPIARPKGMWTRTFWDHQGTIEAADYAAHEAFVARLQSLNARIDRQAERRRLRQRD